MEKLERNRHRGPERRKTMSVDYIYIKKQHAPGSIHVFEKEKRGVHASQEGENALGYGKASQQ